MYKEIYKNYIKQKEYIEEKAKQAIEADKVIKTSYVQPKKIYDERIKARFSRQWATINR